MIFSRFFASGDKTPLTTKDYYSKLMLDHTSGQNRRKTMPAKIVVNDSELPIMKALWKKDGRTSTEILSDIDGNKNTLKTLLGRLVERGAVRTEEINQRTYRYFAVVTEDNYIEGQRKTFLDKVFDGSAEKMLLNFVREENISADALQRLADLIER
jgi:BlaI family penicillinase repressor